MKTLDCDPPPMEGATRFLSTLDLVVNEHAAQHSRSDMTPKAAPHEAPITVVGRLVGFTAAGVPLVAFPDADESEAMPARTTVLLTSGQVGSEVVLCFAGERRQPIILGCLITPVVPQIGSVPSEATPPVHVELNGRRLEFTAQDEIVLRCGKASITLTAAGKVLIRGEYLLSRSAGVNRIKGGSVQIN